MDLVAEGDDVAIRLGDLDDSSFGARKLQTLRRMLVASPAYLQARGTPKTAADLAAHDCIFGPGNFGRDSWSFSRDGTETSVDVRGRIHTNSGPGAFASVMAGLGIVMASTVMCAAELKAGALGPAAARLQACAGGLHTVSPAARARRQKSARWLIFWRKNSNRLLRQWRAWREDDLPAGADAL
jgi:DNA-binding transcriptional LysR family regulator